MIITKLFGKDNGAWKARPGYAARHYRVYSALGKAKKCCVCGTRLGKIEYARKGPGLLTKSYVPMCVSCHARDDKRIKHINK